MYIYLKIKNVLTYIKAPKSFGLIYLMALSCSLSARAFRVKIVLIADISLSHGIAIN